MAIKKTLTGIAVGATLIIGGGTVDLVPVNLHAQAWAQYHVSEYKSSWTETTATGTIEHITDVPNFADDNGDGLISYSIAVNKKGERVYTQISEDAYAKLGKKDGSRFNLDYPAVDKITLAEAIMEGLMPNVAEASIAFDAFSDMGFVNPGSSITFSHTVSGTYPIIFFGIWASPGSGSFTASYNGASSTFITSKTDPQSHNEAMLYLINPDTGTHNAVVGQTGGTYMGGLVSSYTGADQAAQPDASATFSGSITSAPWQLTTNITTVADNSWIIEIGRDGADGVMTAVSGVVKRGGTNGYFQLFDSNSAKTPAGSATIVNGTTATRLWSYGVILVSFKPATIVNTQNNGCHGEFHGTIFCQQ